MILWPRSFVLSFLVLASSFPVFSAKVESYMMLRTKPDCAAATATPPSPVWLFIATEPQAILWFRVSEVKAGDVVRSQYTGPDGRAYIPGSGEWQPAPYDGNFCFSDHTFLIAGNPPAAQPGLWTVRVTLNNTPLFSLTFGIAPAGGIVLDVPASANVFASGRASTAPIGGALPPSYAFPAGPGKVLSFHAVAGWLHCGPNPPWEPNGPEGLAYATDIASYNNISGIVHPRRSFFLVGVFLADSPPTAASARLDFTTDSFARLAPAIGQTFFIGDGLTGAGSGTRQQFEVPAAATRLYLGFADASYFRGTPGSYHDNAGTLTASFEITPGSAPPPVCTYALSALTAAAPASGSTGTVGVVAGAGCAWSAQSNVPWISVTAGASGSQPGPVTYSVAANPEAAQRTGTLTIAGQLFTVTQAGAAPPPPPTALPSIDAGGVVNAADYTPAVAPGALFSIFGSRLAPGPRSASAVPLPRALDGVAVEVFDGDKTFAAPLFYVSSNQINAQMPFEVAGDTVAVRVRTPSGESAAQTVAVHQRCPRVFTRTLDGKGEPILVHADYSLVSAAAPAVPGETLMLFATGLGAVDPTPATGAAAGDGAPGRPLNLVTDTVAVMAGGQKAQVHFAGLAPGYVGLYQINFTVPRDVYGSPGAVTVRCSGAESQAGVAMAIRPAAPLATFSVGSGGGTIHAAGIRVAVPAGAYGSEQAVALYRDSPSQSPNQVSDTYRLVGLGSSPAAPITIAVDLNRAPPGDANLSIVVEAMGEETAQPSRFLPVRVEGNSAVATLPGTAAGTHAADAGERPLQSGGAPPAASRTWLVIRVTATSVLFETDHFRYDVELYTRQPNETPPGERPEIPDIVTLGRIANLMEQALQKMEQDVKLPWTCGPFSRGAKMTVKVHPLAQGTAGLSGLNADSPLELNSAMMGLLYLPGKKEATSEALDEVVRAGPHEMFHLLQNCYAGDKNYWLWMDEAAATWFETRLVQEMDAIVPMSIGGTRPPPNVTARESFAFALRHGLVYNLGSQIPVQRHGYGASQFLQYFNMLAQAPHAETFTARLYKRAPKFPKSPLDAVRELVSEMVPKQGIEAHWHAFNKRWFEGRVYQQATGSFPGWGDFRRLTDVQPVTLSPGDSVELPWDAPDLSARLFRITPANAKQGWPAKTQLIARLEDPGGEGYWGVYSSRLGLPKDRNWLQQIDFQKSSRGEARITEVEKVADGYTDLFLLVANGRAVAPYTGTSPMRLTLRVEPFVRRLSQFKEEVEAWIAVGVNTPKSCTIPPGTAEAHSVAGIRFPRQLGMVWAYPSPVTAQLRTNPETFEITIGRSQGTGRISFRADFAGDTLQEASVFYTESFTTGEMKGASKTIAFTIRNLPVAPLGTSTLDELVFEANPATRANVSSLSYSAVGNGGAGSCSFTENDLNFASSMPTIQLRVRKAP